MCRVVVVALNMIIVTICTMIRVTMNFAGNRNMTFVTATFKEHSQTNANEETQTDNCQWLRTCGLELIALDD